MSSDFEFNFKQKPGMEKQKTIYVIIILALAVGILAYTIWFNTNSHYCYCQSKDALNKYRILTTSDCNTRCEQNGWLNYYYNDSEVGTEWNLSLKQ